MTLSWSVVMPRKSLSMEVDRIGLGSLSMAIVVADVEMLLKLSEKITEIQFD
jgi:hypothetical protein